MINAKLFSFNGGQIRGLQQVGTGTFGAVPKAGDYINMGAAATDVDYKVVDVVYLINEDGVRLIVVPWGV